MKTDEVKAFFEKTDVYLTYNYNLRIRAETVGHFIQGMTFGEVLDMPCGTGDISAPFIDQFGQLLMMDFSENMIATSRSRVPETELSKVQFVNGDFYAHDFKGQTFDLVMNIGILAHIKDPWKFLQKTMQLVNPGGHLIIQNTDADHWFAKLIHRYLAFRRMVGKDKYKLNKVREKELLQRLYDGGFEVISSFRYNQSFLGLSRFFSNKLKYRLTRKFFGYPSDNKRSKSGSDVTFFLRKKTKY
jgi:ubiquinone/menaquinone biosynthesis C-methylase UbiE